MGVALRLAQLRSRAVDVRAGADELLAEIDRMRSHHTHPTPGAEP